MTHEVKELAAEIRPGVLRPDWSAVTTAAARRALNGRMSARAGLLDKWSHALDPDEDLVWRTVLQHYAASGRSPEASEVADNTGLAQSRVDALLRKLQLRDLVGLENGSEIIRHALPLYRDRNRAPGGTRRACPECLMRHRCFGRRRHVRGGHSG